MDGDDQDQEAGNVQYHQAGLIVYGDDDNYTKFDRLATNASGPATEKFEFINEVAGRPATTRGDSTANLPAGPTRPTST